jgi:hypothetical protein
MVAAVLALDALFDAGPWGMVTAEEISTAATFSLTTNVIEPT